MTAEKSVEITIKCDIISGVYEVGKEIHSIRELARLQNVSTTTVKNALAKLKNEGIIIARPARNYIVNDNADRVCRQEISQMIRDKLIDIITLATMANISSSEFQAYFSDIENEMLGAIIGIVINSLDRKAEGIVQ